MRRGPVGRSHTRKACPSRKIRYKTEKDATQVVRGAQPKREGAPIPLRAYPCNFCNGWHLTSQAEERPR